MKAYIIKTNTLVHPFNEDVSLSIIVNETLAETQNRVLTKLGYTPEIVSSLNEINISQNEKSLILTDRVFITENLAKNFIKAAKNINQNCVLSLKQTEGYKLLTPLQNISLEKNLEGEQILVFDFYLINKNVNLSTENNEDIIKTLREDLLKDCKRIITPRKEKLYEIRVPTVGTSMGIMQFPLTSSLICQIESWVHILWLNQFSWIVKWMEFIRNNKFKMALMVLKAFFTTFSFNRFKLLSKLNKIGKNCKIHPTAYLEGCIIGDNTRIGAQTCLRNSIVGKNSTIADHTVALNSIIGDNNYITEDTFMVHSVVYPDSTVGNLKIQVSLIGKNSYISTWASFIDAKFKGYIKVNHNGKLISSGRTFMGSCVGHNTIMGAKVLIQPGRAIPSNLTMVMRPDEVINTIPSDLPEGIPLVREDGTLVPLTFDKIKNNPSSS